MGLQGLLCPHRGDKTGEILVGGACSALDCTILLSSLRHQVSALVPLQSCQCLAWKPHPVVAWGAESQHVVAGYSDGTIRVFSISRTEMELKMQPHVVALTAIAYSTDGEAASHTSVEHGLVVPGLP